MRQNLDYDVFFLNVFSYFSGDFERVPASKWRLFSIFFFFERNNGMISDTVMDRHFWCFKYRLITVPLERVPASKWRLFSIFFFFERNNGKISDTVMDRHFWCFKYRLYYGPPLSSDNDDSPDEGPVIRVANRVVHTIVYTNSCVGISCSCKQNLHEKIMIWYIDVIKLMINIELTLDHLFDRIEGSFDGIRYLINESNWSRCSLKIGSKFMIFFVKNNQKVI